MNWGVWWGLGLERPAWASLPPAVIRDQEQRGELPPGSAAQLGGVVVTRRLRATRRPELVVTSGPLHLAQTGGGTVGELYGARWALGLYRGGPRLYQARSGVWLDRTDPDALGELAAQGVRHVSLAFDQAARPVLAWERDGAVYVRQWDGVAGGYRTRGPWPGRDPLLLSDAPLLGATGDSDVLLLYVHGAALAYRLQREAYGTARDLAPLPEGAVLDQVWAAGHRFTVAGAAPDGSPLYLASAPYPLRALDALSGAVRLSGVLTDTMQRTASLDALSGAARLSGTVTDTMQRAASLDALSGSARLSGALVAVSALLTYTDATAGAARLSGSLAVTVQAVTLTDATTGAARLSGALTVIVTTAATADAATGAASLSGSLT